MSQDSRAPWEFLRTTAQNVITVALPSCDWSLSVRRTSNYLHYDLGNPRGWGPSNLELASSCGLYSVYLGPFSFQCHFKVIGVQSRNGLERETAGRRVKTKWNWDLGLAWNTFDLLCSRLFGALVPKWPVTQKRLAVERNWLKFRARR